MALDYEAVLYSEGPVYSLAISVLLHFAFVCDDLPCFARLHIDASATKRALVLPSGSVGISQRNGGVVLEVLGVDAEETGAM